MTRFTNKVMERGKKGLAERIVYDAFDILETRTGRNGLEVFKQALYNATPIIEVKPRRVGGATYQVPVQIEGQRRTSLAIRWLLQSARSRSGKTMSEKLAPNCWTPSTTPARRSSGVRIRTAWRRPTRPSRTIAGNRYVVGRAFQCPAGAMSRRQAETKKTR